MNSFAIWLRRAKKQHTEKLSLDSVLNQIELYTFVGTVHICA